MVLVHILRKQTKTVNCKSVITSKTKYNAKSQV